MYYDKYWIYDNSRLLLIYTQILFKTLLKEDLDEKKLEELTETFPKFYLHTLETIRRGE